MTLWVYVTRAVFRRICGWLEVGKGRDLEFYAVVTDSIDEGFSYAGDIAMGADEGFRVVRVPGASAARFDTCHGCEELPYPYMEMYYGGHLTALLYGTLNNEEDSE